MLCMSASHHPSDVEPHLVVGGQHAHVERHGAHHRRPRATEQPDRALLLHDADLRRGAAARRRHTSSTGTARHNDFPGCYIHWPNTLYFRFKLVNLRAALLCVSAPN
jgi:hypothetical protein